MEYAFDSNTIIHLMRGTPSVKENLDMAKLRGARFIIPPFVNYEIRRGLIIKPVTSHEQAYAVICNNCDIEEMTETAWIRAAYIYAELYEKRLTVKDADIVIAAFCMANGYTLVTNNTSDFENIDGLRFIDWVTL